MKALTVALIALVGVLAGVVVWQGMAVQAAISPISAAIEYDGEIKAEWIIATDMGHYSDADSSEAFIETDEDETITGNITLSNFTSSAQDRQFALKIDVDGGPVDEVEISLEPKTTFAEENITLKSLDLVRYDESDTELREFSLEVEDNEVDSEVGALAKGEYVLVGVVRSLGSLGNESVAVIYEGNFDCDNSDADSVHEIDFDILGGSLTA